jgi:hypothetical protein
VPRLRRRRRPGGSAHPEMVRGANGARPGISAAVGQPG